MSASAVARSVEILEEGEREASQALVDLALSLRVCEVDASGPEPKYLEDTDEELIEVGGQWNRRAKRWTDAQSETLAIIRVPRGSEQEVAARWLAEWLRRAAVGKRGPQWDDFRRVWTLLLEGGRRGGKSYLGVVALLAYAIMVPRSLAWAISPTQEETDELETTIRGILPRAWYVYRGGGAGKPLQFRLPNGSRVLCLSGYKPRSLKRGRVDIALLNEGQNMHRATWVQLRGAVSDKGGLVVIAANPPDTEIGRWIEEVHERGRAHKIKAEVFKLTAATNPFVEAKSLEDMADENDEKTYRREVLGEFVPIGNTAFHAWSDAESVRDLDPEWIDVTREETERQFGRPFDFVACMDFQRTPHMVAALAKLLRDPDGDLIFVVVDEVIVELADENDLVDALEGRLPEVMPGRMILHRDELEDGRARWLVGRVDDPIEGYDPDACAIVMDASAFWQDGQHSKVKTSEEWLRARRWRWMFRPDRGSKRNPDRVERVKVTNARLKNAAGKRRMFVLRHCERVIRAMRAWELVEGIPKSRSEHAHVCDAVSYGVYRFFARTALPSVEVPQDPAPPTFNRADDFGGVF